MEQPSGMKTCKKCGVEKDESEFHKKARNIDGVRGSCKVCNHRSSTLSTYVSRHGMTQQDVAAIAVRQGGCAICRTAEPCGRGWHMDHNHACENCTRRRGSCDSCRRGVLCSRCNTALGLLDDDVLVILAAAQYVAEWTP